MNEPVTDRELLELAARNGPVTQWFGSKTKPVHTGVYETRDKAFPKSITFQYWSGSYWHRCMGTAVDAYAFRDYWSFFQRPEWRGLATNPNAGGSDE